MAALRIMKRSLALAFLITFSGNVFPADPKDCPDYSGTVAGYFSTIQNISSIQFTQINHEYSTKTKDYDAIHSQEKWKIRCVEKNGKKAYEYSVEIQKKNKDGALATETVEVFNKDGIYVFSSQDGALNIYKKGGGRLGNEKNYRSTLAPPVILGPLYPFLRDSETKENGSFKRFSVFLTETFKKENIQKVIAREGLYSEPKVGSYDPELVGRKFWSMEYPIFDKEVLSAPQTIQIFTTWFNTGGRPPIPIVDCFTGIRGGKFVYSLVASLDKGESHPGESLLVTGIASQPSVPNSKNLVTELIDIKLNGNIPDEAFLFDPLSAKTIFDHSTGIPVEP